MIYEGVGENIGLGEVVKKGGRVYKKVKERS